MENVVERKRKVSEESINDCDEQDNFYGFKRQCIEEALNYYKNYVNSVLNEVNCDNTKSQYAQYLGLQPITTNIKSNTDEVNINKCNSEVNINTMPVEDTVVDDTKSQKITRRVYLCSACGVYFEIWKLFLHMRTVHRRFICLICLGLFSVAEKLSNHLFSKHQIVAKNYASAVDFFTDYGGSQEMYVMCCVCEQLFNEHDNFGQHICETVSDTNKHVKKQQKNCIKLKIKTKFPPSEHITADSNDNSTVNDVETPGASPKDQICNEVVEDCKEVVENDVQQQSNVEQHNDSNELNENHLNDVIAEDDVPEIPRRVPKVTLKLPVTKSSESDSDSDSLKLTMEVEDESVADGATAVLPVSNLVVADVNIPVIELGLRPPLDKTASEVLLKDLLRATCIQCVYCNYARKIAVNGKQLCLHMIAEHRFSATADSITGEELLPETFVRHLQDNLEQLQSQYFNLENYDRTYECFQCRFVTTVHKELYLHNRKMHQKTLLLCIMCKSTFYSYSEMLCHLCPGTYLGTDVNFRCCLCLIDTIPSAFRLMVHLRKRHHACDVCLETCNNQSRLSNHVWKHKLHHLCYRCGIAYRNKPDITKHLFWKHGTESVLCKKCLQKKWPHVYHFCIPPAFFVCDECPLTFSKAVALKVHKRIHNNSAPYVCTEPNCQEKLISKKLLAKHIAAHLEPVQNQHHIKNDDENKIQEAAPTVEPTVPDDLDTVPELSSQDTDAEKPIKPVVDVYDLPALNLSESDSDSDDNSPSIKTVKPVEDVEKEVEEQSQPPPPIDGSIWDNFKNYQAQIDATNQHNDDDNDNKNNLLLLDAVMNDHDYCVTTENHIDDLKEEVSSQTPPEVVSTPSVVAPKSVSDTSGSDSDSSSCSCGSNCSCSSSSSSQNTSSSSSSSSDSDSSTSERRRTTTSERRTKRKERVRSRKKEDSVPPPLLEESQPPQPGPSSVEEQSTIIVADLPIYESDLYTDESDTDEDFYDESPQLLAKKLIQEKKNQLLMDVVDKPILNGGTIYESSPVVVTPAVVTPSADIKKKTKSKKRRKQPRKESTLPTLKLNIPNTFLNVTVNETKSTAVTTTTSTMVTTPVTNNAGSSSENDSLRLSKRRRVPNKFYGYSSDEEHQRNTTIMTTAMTPTTPITISLFSKPPEPPQLEWNKEDLPSPPPKHETSTPSSWSIKQNTEEQKPVVDIVQEAVQATTTTTTTTSDSSSTDDSDDERLHITELPTPTPPPVIHPQPPSHTAPLTTLTALGPSLRPAVNLYCYCQCPYDEVSEMIACDGKRCAIEWFHFECVGIMVPPKGKWYCPDCRKQNTSSTSTSSTNNHTPTITTAAIAAAAATHQRPEYFMSQ